MADRFTDHLREPGCSHLGGATPASLRAWHRRRNASSRQVQVLDPSWLRRCYPACGPSARSGNAWPLSPLQVTSATPSGSRCTVLRNLPIERSGAAICSTALLPDCRSANCTSWRPRSSPAAATSGNSGRWLDDGAVAGVAAQFHNEKAGGDDDSTGVDHRGF